MGPTYVADSVLAHYRLSDEVIALAARRHLPVVTTLGLSRDTVMRDPAALRRVQRTAYDNVRRLAAAGVPILTGSDTYSSREAIENDYLALGEALQLSPLELLRLRAVTTPRAIRPGRSIGALDPGFDASLLALSCDPLADSKCQQQHRRASQGRDLDHAAAVRALGAICALLTADSLLGATLAAMHARNPVPGVSGALVAGDRPDTAIAQCGWARVGSAPGAASLASERPAARRERGKDVLGLAGAAAGGARPARPRSSRSPPALPRPAFRHLPGSRRACCLRHTSGIGEYDAVFMRGAHRRSAARSLAGRLARRLAAHPAGRERHRNVPLQRHELRGAGDVAGWREQRGGHIARSRRSCSSRSGSPAPSRRSIRVCQGSSRDLTGRGSMFGRDAMMSGDSLIYNPQFEWGGGGFASTPSDLARWMADMRLGRAFPLADVGDGDRAPAGRRRHRGIGAGWGCTSTWAR